MKRLARAEVFILSAVMAICGNRSAFYHRVKANEAPKLSHTLRVIYLMKPKSWVQLKVNGFDLIRDVPFVWSMLHSHKIKMMQQCKPCYLSILSNPCSVQRKCQAGSRSSVGSCVQLLLNSVNAC